MKGNKKYENLKSLVEVLPDKPGVYQFFDDQGKFLYIGKARNLKKRVSSYFTQSGRENFKRQLLVSKIRDIRHVVVSSEADALLLENNLIKQHQPRYNVLLKDDKTFPWICIKNERFPRVFYTRNRINDGSVYYGPYTSMAMVKAILETARALFPLRNCSLKLTRDNIRQEKFKVCLEYHLGNCRAPCVGFQSEEDYMESIEQVRQVLKGNIKQVQSFLKTAMKKQAADYKYEDAQQLKEKVEILEKYKSKSTIVNPRIRNADVFSILEQKELAFVNYLKIIDGAVVQAHTVELKKKMEEDREELLSFAIIDIRDKTKSDSKEVIVPFGLDLPLGNVRFTVPMKGDKKQLLELSERNVRHYSMERKKRMEESQKTTRTSKILQAIKKDLHLTQIPVQIDCFDNSNLMGSDPVAACVVFKNAQPLKREYRHYHVKSVTGPNDYASMQEIITRRYRRLMTEKKPMPQLIVVDGGKGQLNAAVSSLEELDLRGKIAIVGLAKRLEEIYFPGDKIPLYLDKNSETLRVIQHLRNEAHRFGISFHRQQRNKRMTGSALDKIPGIGERSRSRLLQVFRSVEEIKQMDMETIAEIVGQKKARILKDYFNRSTT